MKGTRRRGGEHSADITDIDLALVLLAVDDEDADGADDEDADVGTGTARDPAVVEGIDLGHDHQGLCQVVLSPRTDQAAGGAISPLPRAMRRVGTT